MEQTEMKYSIAIVSKSNHDVLEKSIEELIPEIKTAEKYEIIIVEELGVKRPIRKKNLHYYWIPEKNYGIGYARNFALERCKGDIIIFLDDDVRPHSVWFQNLISPFEDPEVGGVGGAIFPERKGINTVGKCISLLGFPAGGVQRSIDVGGKLRETEWISTGNCAFRRKYFEAVGGFDPFLRG